MPPAAVLGTLGAISGAQKDVSNQSQSINVGNATANELTGQQGMMNSFGQLQNMVNAGPGAQDVTNAYNAQTGLAGMYSDYSKGGYMPNAQDMSQASGLAQALFNPQQTALNQSFVNQTQQAAQSAAVMGRDSNDPVLQAKLRTNQNNLQAQLSAQQGAFGSQYAQQMPQQRLQYAAQSAGLLGGLASQALQNRQAIAGMGEGIMNNERQWRLQTASHSQTQSSGGGLKGAINGGIAGFGAGMNLMKGDFSGMQNFGQQANNASQSNPMAGGSNPFAGMGGGASASGGGSNGFGGSFANFGADAAVV